MSTRPGAWLVLVLSVGVVTAVVAAQEPQTAPSTLPAAPWVFDVYLNERLTGASRDPAWLRVVRTIEQTDEWRQKHGGGSR